MSFLLTAYFTSCTIRLEGLHRTVSYEFYFEPYRPSNHNVTSCYWYVLEIISLAFNVSSCHFCSSLYSKAAIVRSYTKASLTIY